MYWHFSRYTTGHNQNVNGLRTVTVLTEYGWNMDDRNSVFRSSTVLKNLTRPDEFGLKRFSCMNFYHCLENEKCYPKKSNNLTFTACVSFGESIDKWTVRLVYQSNCLRIKVQRV